MGIEGKVLNSLKAFRDSLATQLVSVQVEATPRVLAGRVAMKSKSDESSPALTKADALDGAISSLDRAIASFTANIKKPGKSADLIAASKNLADSMKAK